MKRFNWPPFLLLAPAVCFLVLVFVVPLFQVVWSSFFAPDFTLRHYQRIWNVPVYARVFWTTLRISTLTTIVCLLLAYPTAYFLASLRPTARQFFLLCIVIPFFLSVLVRNYIWILLLQTRGLINQTLIGFDLISQPIDLLYSETGVLIGMVNILLPYMIFPILGALQAIPPVLSHASASLGANSFQTFWRVTLPLTLPGVFAGSLLVFIVSLGFFITPFLLGGPRQMMLSNLIEFSVRQTLDWPFAFALANTLLMITFILYFVYVKLFPSRIAGSGFP